MLIFFFFVFIFGLAIGSFLNVVVYRLENGESIVNDRSHCMDCRHALAWYDLIPVLSFLALGGRCRYCRKSISWQYLLVELATGILFIMVFFTQGGSVADGVFALPAIFPVLFWLFIISSLIVIFVYDLKHYIIPDRIVYSAIMASGIWYLASGIFLGLYTRFDILNLVFAAIVAGGFFLSIVLITHGQGMGGGDVKLAFLMGLVLGWPKILLALFLAFTLGAICGIILMFLKKKTFRSEIPFGPFLVIGTIVAIFWGEEIVKWYGRYLF